MDATCFDAFTRSLSTTRSRRDALAALLGGSFGIFGLVHPDDAKAAKSGKCKPDCGPCATCAKGKCKKKNGKKKCKKGTCVPTPNDTICNGTGRCLNGTCNDLPVCAQFGAGCSTANPGTCCSDVCIVTGMMVAACSFGAPGQECIAGTDCASGGCVGFRCL